jgi:DNA repair photolyase
MARARYIPITCKSALNRVQGMPFKWSLNPYRGCVHACHYCYARATHTYLGLNADDDFETQIFLKSNIADVLDAELGRRSWMREQIAIGTATDAYQPAEGQFELTRRCLEVIGARRNPVSIVTKSTLIVRDIELLTEMTINARTAVYFTVTTMDYELSRILEPGTPPPRKRMEAMSRLAEAGVQCSVLMAPVVPGLTDDAASIDAVSKAAAEYGAESFTGLPLRLAPYVKEHFLEWLQLNFPGLLPWYRENFWKTNLPEAEKLRIASLAQEASDRHQLVRRRRSSETAVSPTEVNTQDFQQLEFQIGPTRFAPSSLSSQYDPAMVLNGSSREVRARAWPQVVSGL